MKRPRRHHETPRFYLNRFVDPDGRVWTYDTDRNEVYAARPEDTGVEAHLYSVTTKTGDRSAKVEDLLAKIEEKAAPLFPKLIRGERIVGEERADLASFFAMSVVRTNQFRRQYAEGHMGLIQTIMKRTAARADFDRFFDRYAADIAPNLPGEKEVLRDAMGRPEDFRVTVDKEYTVRALGLHDALLPIIFGMKWSTLVTDGPRWLITSDNPIVRETPTKDESPFGDGGYLHPEATVTMPLSPRACWIARWDTEAPRPVLIDREHVSDLNRVRAAYAERYLYASERKDGIRSLGQKHRAAKPHMVINGDAEKLSEVSLRRSRPPRTD